MSMAVSLRQNERGLAARDSVVIMGGTSHDTGTIVELVPVAAMATGEVAVVAMNVVRWSERARDDLPFHNTRTCSVAIALAGIATQHLHARPAFSTAIH